MFFKSPFLLNTRLPAAVLTGFHTWFGFVAEALEKLTPTVRYKR